MQTTSNRTTWIWQWIVACAVTQVLQIWGDGLASEMPFVMGFSNAPGTLSFIVVIALFRLFSSALGGLVQGLVLAPKWTFIRNWAIATGIGSAIALMSVNILYFATLTPLSGDNLLDFLEVFTGRRSVLPQFVFTSLTGFILGMAQKVNFVLQLNHLFMDLF